MFRLHRQRWFYYFTGCVVLLPLLVIWYFYPRAFTGLFTFFVGFFWNYAIDTPGVAERVRKRRYRFSFLRLITKFDQWLRTRVARIVESHLIRDLLRAVTPSFFVGCLYLFTYVLPPYWSLLGSLYYLLWQRQIWRRLSHFFN